LVLLVGYEELEKIFLDNTIEAKEEFLTQLWDGLRRINDRAANGVGIVISLPSVPLDQNARSTQLEDSLLLTPPFLRSEVQWFIERALGVATVAADLVDEVYKATGGNPWFLVLLFSLLRPQLRYRNPTRISEHASLRLVEEACKILERIFHGESTDLAKSPEWEFLIHEISGYRDVLNRFIGNGDNADSQIAHSWLEGNKLISSGSLPRLTDWLASGLLLLKRRPLREPQQPDFPPAAGSLIRRAGNLQWKFYYAWRHQETAHD
jgi:hypothetical protein